MVVAGEARLGKLPWALEVVGAVRCRILGHKGQLKGLVLAAVSAVQELDRS